MPRSLPVESSAARLLPGAVEALERKGSKLVLTKDELGPILAQIRPEEREHRDYMSPTELDRILAAAARGAPLDLIRRVQMTTQEVQAQRTNETSMSTLERWIMPIGLLLAVVGGALTLFFPAIIPMMSQWMALGGVAITTGKQLYNWWNQQFPRTEAGDALREHQRAIAALLEHRDANRGRERDERTTPRGPSPSRTSLPPPVRMGGVNSVREARPVEPSVSAVRPRR